MKMKNIVGLIAVVAIAVAVMFAGCVEEETSVPTSKMAEPTPETTQTTAPAETPTSNAIQAGTYKVGSDIQPGLYKVIVKDSVMDMGYIDRSKDARMELDSIIANGIIINSGYVRIKEGDAYVKIQGATLYPEDTIEINIRDMFEDGIYLVGVDIAPGTYKVEVTDTTMDMGYVERQSDVSMEFDDIISNEIFQGQGYVEIMSSDFSVKVQGAKLIKV
jgi:hypothetical protein